MEAYPITKKKISTKHKLILGAAGAIAFMSVAGAGALAYAQSATNTNNATALIDRVAQLAGVDAAKLTNSFKQAEKEQVDKKVADGELTQTQADQIKQQIDNGNLMIGKPEGPFGRGMKGGMGFMMQDRAALAKFLGLSEADLQTKMQSGTTLIDIAKAQGKSETDLKNFLSTQFDTNLKQAVTDGKLTQTQADEIAKNKDAMITHEMSETHRGGPRGGRGFKDGFGPGNFPTTTTTTPSAS